MICWNYLNTIHVCLTPLIIPPPPTCQCCHCNNTTTAGRGGITTNQGVSNILTHCSSGLYHPWFLHEIMPLSGPENHPCETLPLWYKYCSNTSLYPPPTMTDCVSLYEVKNFITRTFFIYKKTFLLFSTNIFNRISLERWVIIVNQS